MRKAALDALAQLVEQGLSAGQCFLSPGAYNPLQLVCARLEDADGAVRRAAVLAVAEIAKKGDAVAVAKVCNRTNDPDWKVRRRVERSGSRATESFGSLHIRIPLHFGQNSGIFFTILQKF